MANFKTLTSFVCTTYGDDASDESKYWSQYQFPVLLQQKGMVHGMKFGTSNHFIVAASTKIDLFDGENGHFVSCFSKFKTKVLCCAMRKDDGMVLGGSEDGFVRIFDVKHKSLLRKVLAHSGPVRGVGFSDDKSNVYSCSDDKNVKVIDVISGSVVKNYTESGFVDSIRCLDTCTTRDVFACGSYDKTLKVFDKRLENPVVATLSHGHPIDAVKFHSRGNLIFSGGGRSCRVWDIRSCHSLTTLQHHHKNIMSIALSGDESRLLTAGIDRLVKIYNTDAFDNLHTLRYVSPIMSVAVSKDNKHLVAGMADGSVLLKTKREKNIAEEPKKRFISMDDGPTAVKRKRLLNMDLKPISTDFQVSKEHITRQVLPKRDMQLKKFNHCEALVATFNTQGVKEPEVIYSMLCELKRRNRLEAGISSFSYPHFRQFVLFLSSNITNSSMTDLLSDVVMLLVDCYCDSEYLKKLEIRNKLRAIQTNLRHKVHKQQLLNDVVSQMECVVAGANNYYVDYKEPLRVELV